MNKNSILTVSGVEVNVFKPTPDMFHIEDIASGLSKICRFTGQIPKFYSVAQHSVLCSRAVYREYKLAALLHDASEAYIQDIASPIKQNLPDYLQLEDLVMRWIAERFQFEYPLPEAVHKIDKVLFNIENRTFRGNGNEGVTLRDFWSPDKAYKEFMLDYNILTKIRK